MNCRSLFGFIVIALLVCFDQSAPARPRRSSSAVPSATVSQTVISAVTANSITVNDGATTKTLIVSPVSEITLNGQKATITDLKAGMVVGSVVLSDPTHASRIAATSGAPPAK